MPLEPLIAGYNCVTQGRSFNQHPTADKRSNESLRQAKKRGCACKRIDSSLLRKRNLSLSAFENSRNENCVFHDMPYLHKSYEATCAFKCSFFEKIANDRFLLRAYT